jgi:hypothetical protein
MVDPGVDSGLVQDAKEKLMNALIDKVQTYYEVQKRKKEKNITITTGCYVDYIGVDMKELMKKNKEKMGSMGSTGISWKDTFGDDEKMADVHNTIQALSNISYDISVDMGGYDEETTVTICMPYDNLRQLFVMDKEEKKMAGLMHCDEICEYLGIQKKTPSNKPKWIEGLPAVKKVETYNNRVVKVTFIDGTFTKAVCSENDNFDLDMGITICAMKRLLGTNSENATREYNRFISHVHNVMEKNSLDEVAEEARRAKEKAKKRKAELKRAAKKLKAREEQIDIQKQAILRAQKETFSQFEGGAPI